MEDVVLEYPSAENHVNTPAPLQIKDLKTSTTVYGWLLVSQAQQRTATSGRGYLQFTLHDPAGSEIIARQFNVPVRASDIPEGCN